MTENRGEWVLGFMSGTSMDGVDAALIRTDGETVFDFGPSAFRAYEEDERAMIRAAAARALKLERPKPEDFAAEAREVAIAHADAARGLLAKDGCPQPSLIGFHGQTLAHRPDQGWSLQIGDAQELAARLKTPVIHQFRRADVAAGGQGAPLAPFYHFALARRIGGVEPLAFLNLGGVGNVTWVDPTASSPETEGALLAFDTGPANAIIDDWMRNHGAGDCDADGGAASAGAIVSARLAAWRARAAYLEKAAPKSLDRDDFAWVATAAAGLSLEDGAATLTAFSAECVAAASAYMPTPPARWLVCGGGRRNPAMMAALRERIQQEVDPVEWFQLDGDMLEAQAFAHLAMRSARNMPLSAAGSTGVAAPTMGGERVEPLLTQLPPEG